MEIRSDLQVVHVGWLGDEIVIPVMDVKSMVTNLHTSFGG